MPNFHLDIRKGFLLSKGCGTQLPGHIRHCSIEASTKQKDVEEDEVACICVWALCFSHMDPGYTNDTLEKVTDLLFTAAPLKINIKHNHGGWRFGSDHLPSFSWVMAVGESC